MARIEISMEEYQGMKDKIESLEKSLADSKKETELYRERFIAIHDTVEDAADISLFNRLFNWKKIFKSIIDTYTTT